MWQTHHRRMKKSLSNFLHSIHLLIGFNVDAPVSLNFGFRNKKTENGKQNWRAYARGRFVSHAQNYVDRNTLINRTYVLSNHFWPHVVISSTTRSTCIVHLSRLVSVWFVRPKILTEKHICSIVIGCNSRRSSSAATQYAPLAFFNAQATPSKSE